MNATSKFSGGTPLPGINESEIVIVALSGRALAQSAAKLGRPVVVLDASADRDTRRIADTECVAADESDALDAAALDFGRIDAALRARTTALARLIVPGIGFERAPAALTLLRQHGLVFANDADVIATLKHPELSTELLRETGWTVPETRLVAPDAPDGWLEKEIGGAGGWHVRRAVAVPRSAFAYFQRELPGAAMSVTFLADGQAAHVLGFNRQFTVERGDMPFCYAGATICAFEPRLREEVQHRLDRLVRATGLRGLNGLDFLLYRGGLTALEVNPRPTSTFELYEDAVPEGLVYWHLRSFTGSCGELKARLAHRDTSVHAQGIAYADHPIEISADGEFPEWCRDVPMPGRRIAPGQPVVSIMASGDSEAQALRQLDVRKRALVSLLAGWRTDLNRAA